MADEGFKIRGVVELVADEKSIEAVADDADRELRESRRGGPRARLSPASPGQSGAARDALTGVGGAALAKQIGGEFSKVQEKSSKAAQAVSPAVAGAVGGLLRLPAKTQVSEAFAKSRARALKKQKRLDDQEERKKGADPAAARRRSRIQQAVIAGAAGGNIKSLVLGIVKSGPFLAAAAVVGGALIVSAVPKLLTSIADKRLNKLTGLPGAEFSPELSALALRRRIRERQRTIETGRIRGPSASALAFTADENLDKLARIGAVIGVGLDKLLTFILDRLDPFLTLIENVLRWLYPNLFTGAGPASLNLPINLLFGSLRANAVNPIIPIPVRP